jgi:hypothetical protein
MVTYGNKQQRRRYRVCSSWVCVSWWMLLLGVKLLQNKWVLKRKQTPDGLITWYTM